MSGRKWFGKAQLGLYIPFYVAGKVLLELQSPPPRKLNGLLTRNISFKAINKVIGRR